MIRKAQLRRRLEKYWTDEFSDTYTVQCFVQGRCDTDGPVVGMFLGRGEIWSLLV